MQSLSLNHVRLRRRAGLHGRWAASAEQGHRPAILRAMRTLPRERFVPPDLASLAYIDEDLPLPGGRSFVEPLVLARLIQLARVRSGERASSRRRRGLWGGGSGGLRRRGHRARGGRGIVGPRATDVARGRAGRDAANRQAADGAPGPWTSSSSKARCRRYRLGSRQFSPDRGRRVTVLAQTPGLGQGVLAEPINPGTPNPVARAQAHFDCATPLLPMFQKRPGFQF